MATVRVPAPLRRLTSEQRIVTASGKTLAELVRDLDRQFPGFAARVLDNDGKILSFVNVFVDNEDVRFLQGLQTPVGNDTEVAIIPAMAGG
ncbi:MAG TPA: MoaD/ThiS family protein [bacterium]|nr:MoaD/ThiS family protein [bacterium]